MQESSTDSVYATGVLPFDSIKEGSQVLIETESPKSSSFSEKLYSRSVISHEIPDWYFIVLILVTSILVSAKIAYTKFFGFVWTSAFSYQSACKIYKERSIVQKRFNFGLVLLYLVNASLFLYVLHSFFELEILEGPEKFFVLQIFLLLLALTLIRVGLMRLIGFIFDRSLLFTEFLYHYFTYSRVLGLVLIPFITAIPYTAGIVQVVVVYSAITTVFAFQVIRVYRAIVYLIKNVFLLYYLILYLCTLEILPLLVVIKILFG